MWVGVVILLPTQMRGTMSAGSIGIRARQETHLVALGHQRALTATEGGDGNCVLYRASCSNTLLSGRRFLMKLKPSSVSL